MLKFLSATALALMLTGVTGSLVLAEKLGIGRIAHPDEVAAWDIDVRPDGAGLPQGSGNVLDGEEIYIGLCASCHGDFGEGIGRWPVVAGGQDTLRDDRAVKTLGSYWPYLSTVFDYVRRTMPFGEPGTLSDDDVYALVAYLLYANDIVLDEDFELSRENFLSVRLPNEDGFYADDRPETEYPLFTQACMSNCKEQVIITRQASGQDVTPD